MIPADAGKIRSHDVGVNSQGDVMPVTSTRLLTSLGPIPKHSFSKFLAGIMAATVSSSGRSEYTAQRDSWLCLEQVVFLHGGVCEKKKKWLHSRESLRQSGET